MGIIFAGGSAYEFGGVAALSTIPGRFDADYAEGAIVKGNGLAKATVALPVITTENEVWVHMKAWLSLNWSGNTDYNIIEIRDGAGADMVGVKRKWNGSGGGYHIYSGSSEVSIAGAIYENLADIDLHYYAEVNRRCLEFYQNGSLIATVKFTGVWNAPAYVYLGGTPNGDNYYSELIVTEGNEPTIGWRLHTKRPDPALPGLNTFDSGFWGALANDSMESGVSTTSELARVTGGFSTYTGAAMPIGIRGIMQTGRFIRNNTLLQLNGQLRIDDVNYDTPDREFRDTTRIFSLWENNPATDEPFQVSDLSGLQGGFYTILES